MNKLVIKPSIDIRNFDFSYGNKQVLHQVNLSFSGKGIYGIIGPNGSGKTTLLKAISKANPSRDSIYLNQREINQFSRKDLAQQVAILSQSSDQIEAKLLVKDIVLAGRYPHKNFVEAYGPEDYRIAKEMMDLTGIREYAEREFRALSGGEKQRVMIAKALTQKTDILLLDEPTNHLDVQYKIELMQHIQDFPGLVLISIHDLNLAARFCTDLVVLEKGRVVALGPPEQVLQEDLLKRVFNVDFQIIREPQLIIYF